MTWFKTFKALCLVMVFGGGLAAPAGAGAVPAGAAECVILLHGLARSEHSMARMLAALQRDSYAVINVGYPSRHQTIDELATTYIGRAVTDCRKGGAKRINIVTHSMGGILVRYYLKHNELEELGRVVMLSPPNQGSEVVDRLRDVPGFKAINGPAGRQLGTDAAGLPGQLGPVTYPVGIITGNKSINLFLSLLIPGKDDGKVSIERSQVEGMTDFLVVPHPHPLIMNSDLVIDQTRFFLRHGRFRDLST
jgi:pimeloyl-ACP methyl ester carboxylesterase